MEVSKAPPAEVPNARSVTSAVTGQGSQSAADPAPVAADRTDISPLDIASALQILLAEVLASLDLPMEPVIPQSPAQAARILVETLLHGLPEDAVDAPAWAAALTRVEAAMQSGIERALGIVTNWRDVPAAVLDAVKETRVLFWSALSDEPEIPLWFRPEWMGLVQSLHRFRRRRRNARRRLTDPDQYSGSLDESDELR
ncbi:MAG TPA: hypothetical protein VGO37_08505 [Steroidobacteraceae bacterium]|nr:hypothetical protein [Steroidobacteraceae bacterium]